VRDIEAQTFKGFQWVVPVDQDTPPVLLEEWLADLAVIYVRVHD
jgi:hypothetical protein